MMRMVARAEISWSSRIVAVPDGSAARAVVAEAAGEAAEVVRGGSDFKAWSRRAPTAAAGSIRAKIGHSGLGAFGDLW